MQFGTAFGDIVDVILEDGALAFVGYYDKQGKYRGKWVLWSCVEKQHKFKAYDEK